MKLNNTVVTLALLGVLALAALAGGLLPAGSPVHAAKDPLWDDNTSSRSVAENTPPGVNIGAPISATDPDETGANNTVVLEFGQTLTYKLGGTDADKFDIDASTGQLITKASLDFENPSGVGGTAGDNDYVVTVTVDDGETREMAVTREVTIEVTDENELPLAPPPPTVVSGPDSDQTAEYDESTTTLKVVWHPLVNTGRPGILSYAVQYKESTGTSFRVTNVDHSDTATTATITDLSPNTSYQVRVQARNSVEAGPWSLVGTGSTNKAGNSSPNFPQSVVPHELTVGENSSPGQSVGARVTADDADARTLSYEFEGRDANLFDFNTSNGQIRTKRGVTYNHEDPACGYVDTARTTVCTYYVTVVVFDGAGGRDALRVAIRVTDREELPSAPARPTVRPTANSRTSLDVSWSEPSNAGPAITSYRVEYRRKGSTDDFSIGGVVVTGTTATISGTDMASDTDPLTPWLTAGTSYEVRVRATSNEGTGGWSPLGTGSTNVGNREPVFRDRNIDTTPVGADATTTRELNENTPSGRPVGRPVVADDGDGDKRTYKLVATDTNVDGALAAVAKFEINDSTGQIRTEAPLDHEDTGCGYVVADDTPTPTIATTCIYMVVVEVRDGLDANGDTEADETPADDTITVTITVNDVNEPPSVPLVVLASPGDVTNLSVRWSTANTGPGIINHDLRYREGNGLWQTDNCSITGVTAGTNTCSAFTPTVSTAQIESLTANTQYSVQMRARNVEGESAWSPAVSQRTNRNKSGTTANSAPTLVQTPNLSVDESHERRGAGRGERHGFGRRRRPAGLQPRRSQQEPVHHQFNGARKDTLGAESRGRGLRVRCY